MLFCLHLADELEQNNLLTLCIQDGGGGIPAEVLQHVLIPFYTSKTTGSGIGLTLCRDIIEAHGGTISLRNNAGGLLVSLTLPRPDGC